jgi:hypothetical protein
LTVPVSVFRFAVVAVNQESEDCMKLIRVIGVFVLVVFVVRVINLSSDVNKQIAVESSTEPKYVALREVKLQTVWYKEGFDAFMSANFTITNPTNVAFKDFTITCTDVGPSGTAIDTNERVIYQVVPAKSKKKFPNVEMGLVHSQVTGVGCKLTDLVVVN